MPGRVHTIASGAVDGAGVPAVSKVSPNLRASAATGALSTIADVVVFPGAVPPFTVTGTWAAPNTRVLAAGLPTISMSAVGVSVNAVGVPTGPMRVAVADPRVSAQ